MNIRNLVAIAILVLVISMGGVGFRMLPPTSGEHWFPYAVASAGAFIGSGLGLIAIAIVVVGCDRKNG